MKGTISTRLKTETLPFDTEDAGRLTVMATKLKALKDRAPLGICTVIYCGHGGLNQYGLHQVRLTENGPCIPTVSMLRILQSGLGGNYPMEYVSTACGPGGGVSNIHVLSDGSSGLGLAPNQPGADFVNIADAFGLLMAAGDWPESERYSARRFVRLALMQRPLHGNPAEPSDLSLATRTSTGVIYGDLDARLESCVGQEFSMQERQTCEDIFSDTNVNVIWPFKADGSRTDNKAIRFEQAAHPDQVCSYLDSIQGATSTSSFASEELRPCVAIWDMVSAMRLKSDQDSLSPASSRKSAFSEYPTRSVQTRASADSSDGS